MHRGFASAEATPANFWKLGMCLTQAGTIWQRFVWLAHWRLRSAPSSGTAPPNCCHSNYLSEAHTQLLEKCHSFGAGGIQAQLNGDLTKLRNHVEQLGMWLENMAGVPRNGDIAPLEKTLMGAKEAGATAFRCALLSGRRYETFQSLADWKKRVNQSLEALKQVVPVSEKHKITLAMENHKD